MKILVTGAKGFIGKNLIAELKNRKYFDIFECDMDTDYELFDTYTKDCEFVFHLAGVNRPKNEQEFMSGNLGAASTITELLKKHNNKAPILMTSSIQAELDNPYGRSKKACEDFLFTYGKDNGVKVLIYRLPNVFGKWCKPNYNSVVATFCSNIANNLPIQIADPHININLVYIDDVVTEFIAALSNNENKNEQFCAVARMYTVTLGEIADLLKSFKSSREERTVSDTSDAFTTKLYSTYLSYLPRDDFCYPLKMNEDNRGSFTEFIRTPDRGQISINILKAGITKGNHWHHSKNEKFLVVSGRGAVCLRKIDSDDIIIYQVSGEKLEVIDIPGGYTHNITNEGDTDMVCIIWVNSTFDKDNPDTYYLDV